MRPGTRPNFPTRMLTPDMPSTQAVFVGLTTLDVIQHVTSEPRWGRKGVSECSELVAGGPAANAAVTFAALIGSATLVTAVGAGGAADAARQDLQQHGVHVIDCAPAGWDLPIATCIIAANGERTVISPGATTSEARLTPRAREAVARAEALLIDGHHPLLAREALSLTRGLKVLDAGSAKTHVEPWLGEFDVVVCSADYAPQPQEHGVNVTRHVLGAGAGAVVVTHGSGPVQWQRQGAREYSVDPPKVKTKDTLGAGDAFHGAFIAGLLQEPPGLESLARAVELATAIASLRCSVVGARSWLEQLPRT
jgi:sugar/nucleoside kinase (ribokinase family)